MAVKKVQTVAVQEEPAHISPRDISIEAMLMSAIDKGVPVETLERLMAMRRELKSEWAKEQFTKAMADFQAESPTIKKTKEVRTNAGGHAYSYAPLESIVEQVRGALKNNGFSYATSMELLENSVRVIVKVTHTAGHSEESPMEVRLGNKTQMMSDSQVIAAAQTFAKRYAFCNAFGILTGDEDNDARPQQETARVATTPVKPAYQTGYTAKVYTQAKEVTDPTVKLKNTIGAQLVNLGYDLSTMTKIEADATVHRVSGLVMSPENYQEIVTRLDVVIGDKDSEVVDELPTINT